MEFEPSANFVERTMARVRKMDAAAPPERALAVRERASRAAAWAGAGTGAFLGLAGLGRFCLAVLAPGLCG